MQFTHNNGRSLLDMLEEVMSQAGLEEQDIQEVYCITYTDQQQTVKHNLNISQFLDEASTLLLREDGQNIPNGILVIFKGGEKWCEWVHAWTWDYYFGAWEYHEVPNFPSAIQVNSTLSEALQFTH